MAMATMPSPETVRRLADVVRSLGCADDMSCCTALFEDAELCAMPPWLYHQTLDAVAARLLPCECGERHPDDGERPGFYCGEAKSEPCPSCGDPSGPCPLDCPDPGCDARDCQRHDDCEGR